MDHDNKSIKGQAVRSGFWFTVCSFVTSGINFLTTILFSRLLTPSEYGETAVYYSTVSIMVIFISLQLRSSIDKAYIEMKGKIESYLSSIVCLTCLLNLLCFSIGIILRKLQVIRIPGILYLFMFAACFASPVIEIFYIKEKFEFKYKAPVFFTLLNLICGTIFAAAGILLLPGHRVYARIIGGGLVEIALGLLLACIIVWKGKCFVRLKYWRYALYYGIPNTFHIAGAQILAQADRIMIQNICGSDKAGIYSIPYSVCMILSVLWSSILAAFNPWLYRAFEAGDYQPVHNNVRLAMEGIVFLLIHFLFWSPYVMKIMVTPEYYGAIELMPVIALGIVFSCVTNLFVSLEQYHKMVYFVPVGTIIAAIINIGLNDILIRNYGYAAAAYTTLLCYLLLVIFHAAVCIKRVGAKIYPYSAMGMACLKSAAAAGIFLLAGKHTGVRILSYCVLIFIWIFKNRDLLRRRPGK